MAALQCEICGGKLIGKPGGIFECDSCGVEYSTEWAKAKVQEIRGTVQIEGSVQVDGVVRIEGGANTNSLLKRGKIALEDENWNEAKALFQEILKIEPERAEGYLGLAMANYLCSNWDAFMPYYIHYTCGELDDSNIQRAYQFATPELKAQFSKTREIFQKRIPLLKEKREALLPASQLIFANNSRIIITPLDGTAVLGYDYSEDNCGQKCILGWEDIVEVAAGVDHTVGLKTDGTVIATNFQADAYHRYAGQCDVTDWTDIVSISAGACHTVGLKSDGTVIATGNNSAGQCNVNSWDGIIAIATGGGRTIGLKADGTVVATDYIGDPLYNWNQCNVQQWKDVVAIAAESGCTIALKSNGTVVGSYAVSGWQDIVMVATDGVQIAGLRLDGTVTITKERYLSDYLSDIDVSGWNDIVFIAMGNGVILGIKSDGSIVVSEGYISSSFESKLNNKKLFADITLLKPKKTEMREHKIKIRNQKRVALKREQVSLQKELANLKGLFSGSKRRELENRLEQIEMELDAL